MDGQPGPIVHHLRLSVDISIGPVLYLAMQALDMAQTVLVETDVLARAELGACILKLGTAINQQMEAHHGRDCNL